MVHVAMQEADDSGKGGRAYVGTERVLLGLLNENEGVASRILFDFGVDSERVRNAIIRNVGTDHPRDAERIKPCSPRYATRSTA